ncbi:MAG TPA: tRNA (adenosine(37)-N6)-dimethylallyltransferase MiaA [Cyclobacteriaceae bacterium]|nr:tRNA (adenosine(37)-N6)-dimethylallyltransferase MiaA [Cyclobacteriaceae bacterium]
MSNPESKRLIVVVGPTAAGKTKLGIALARHFLTDVISADSRQIFREMSIGTAKPGVEEREDVTHHFIDTLSVTDDYNAGKFERDVLSLLDQLFIKHDDVLMVGGSGMYVRAVCEGLDEMPDVPESVRVEILENYRSKGLSWLQQEVMENDPEYFAVVDQMNPARLMRALEIVRTTGLPASNYRVNRRVERPFSVVKIGLEMEREELYKRIDARVDKMIDSGLVEEVKRLEQFKSRNALQTVGYQELFDYFDGKHDLVEAIRLIKRNSRRYAKRQMTWFKREEGIQWFHPDQLEKIITHLDGE